MLPSNNKQMILTNWGGGHHQGMKSLNYSLLKRTLSVVAVAVVFLLFLNSKSKLNEIKHCLLVVLERCVFMNRQELFVIPIIVCM